MLGMKTLAQQVRENIASMFWANNTIDQGVVSLVSILQGKCFLSQGICL